MAFIFLSLHHTLLRLYSAVFMRDAGLMRSGPITRLIRSRAPYTVFLL